FGFSPTATMRMTLGWLIFLPTFASCIIRERSSGLVACSGSSSFMAKCRWLDSSTTSHTWLVCPRCITFSTRYPPSLSSPPTPHPPPRVGRTRDQSAHTRSPPRRAAGAGGGGQGAPGGRGRAPRRWTPHRNPPPLGGPPPLLANLRSHPPDRFPP